MEEPVAEDEPPTLLKISRWAKAISAVFNFLRITPGYYETDVSGIFLVFLTIFAAILIGDSGYGLVFLGGAFVARRFLRHWPAPPFRLLYLLGGGAMIWGALSGVFFGSKPSFLQPFVCSWLVDERSVMLLCFALGTVHLTIARLWHAVRLGWSIWTLAQFGWIATTWTMFFAARSLVLGAAFPSFAWWLFGVGVVLLVLFMTPWWTLKSEWPVHVMLPLNLVTNFVDIVSYLRLFAVGTASLAVASSFNEMFASWDGGVGQFFKVFLLFGGHTLNILLCSLGILVHGVRLNMLEFSSHMGMAWAGKGYEPLVEAGDKGLWNKH